MQNSEQSDDAVIYSRSDSPLPNIVDRLEAIAESISDASLVCLALVAHNDDEALGPGATLATLANMPCTAIILVVFAADNSIRQDETQRAAAVLGLPPERVFQFEFHDGGLHDQKNAVRRVVRLFADGR